MQSKVINGSSISLEKYFREISSQHLLSQEKEVELVRRTRAGDEQAKDELIEANLRFVVSIAKKYRHRGVPLEDLIDEGNIGLIKAIARYDESRGFRFITYAVWWIRQSILAALDAQSRMIRVPTHKIITMSRIKKAEDDWIKKYERAPDNTELALIMHLSEEEISETIESFNVEHSLDEPILKNENRDLSEVVADPDSDTQMNTSNAEQMSNSIGRILSKLKPSERMIIEMFFGVNHMNQMTLDEISRILKISTERVRQLKERSLRKLKYHLVRKQIRSLICD